MKQLIIISVLILSVSISGFANEGSKPTENFNLGGSKRSLTLMPNPATGETQILFVSQKDTKATIKVVDANGKEVLKQESQLINGKNKINIDKSKDLPEGTYTLTLTSNNKMHSVSFVVWKI